MYSLKPRFMCKRSAEIYTANVAKLWHFLTSYAGDRGLTANRRNGFDFYRIFGTMHKPSVLSQIVPLASTIMEYLNPCNISLFHTEICFTYCQQIFVYHRNIFIGRVKKWPWILRHVCFLQQRKYFITNYYFFRAQLQHFLDFFKRSHLLFFLRTKNIELLRRIELASQNLNLTFPRRTTPFSFQGFIRSPRAKSRRVLDLNSLLATTTTLHYKF